MKSVKTITFCTALTLFSQGIAMEKNSSSASEKISNQPKSMSAKDDPYGQPSLLPKKGPYFSVDFLYWQAKEDDLEYAQKGSFKSRGNPFLVSSKLLDLDFDWKPGVKVALGYTFDREHWDLSLAWTYLHSHAHDSAHTNDPTLNEANLRPNWIPVILGSITDKASAHWRLNYNILDLELGKNYLLGKWLALRPHIGLKGVWIHQDYDLKFHGGFQFIDLGGFNTIFKDTSFDADNDYNAIGIALGADTQWFLSSQWSILAKISASLDYGKFRVHEKIDGGFLVSSGASVIINDEFIKFKEDYWRLRSSIETELGVQWQTFFNKDKYRVAFYTTYNFVYWPNQNELINSIVSRDSVSLGANLTNLNANVINYHQEGNLQLQGVKVGMRFDF